MVRRSDSRIARAWRGASDSENIRLRAEQAALQLLSLLSRTTPQAEVASGGLMHSSFRNLPKPQTLKNPKP
jgi:hypothetical protein